MKVAMQLMCTFASSLYGDRIGCKVLVDNPAVSWYEKCGFVREGTRDGYFDMDLGAGFVRVPIVVEELGPRWPST